MAVAAAGRGRGAALALYRSLLRAHAKYLPPEMRQLGDTYVKAEFRAHKAVTNVTQLHQFFTEWDLYLDQIQRTALARSVLSPPTGSSSSTSSSTKNNNNSTEGEVATIFEFGRDLPSNLELTDDQLAQLEKLREEAIKAGGSANR